MMRPHPIMQTLLYDAKRFTTLYDKSGNVYYHGHFYDDHEYTKAT